MLIVPHVLASFFPVPVHHVAQTCFSVSILHGALERCSSQRVGEALTQPTILESGDSVSLQRVRLVSTPY
jgi:hypothetical protein